MEDVFTEKDKIWADFRDENWNSPYLIQYELHPDGIDKNLYHLFLYVSAIQNKPLWFYKVASKLGITVPEMNEFVLNPLHTAVILNNNKLFLFYLPKFDINHTDKNGVTTLQLATQYNRLDMVEYLILKGASLKALDNKKRSLLNFATLSNNLYLIEKFISYYNEEQNPILDAIKNKNYKAVALIGKKYTKTVKDAIKTAIRTRNVKMVKLVLKLFQSTPEDYQEELVIYRKEQDDEIHEKIITLLNL